MRRDYQPPYIPPKPQMLRLTGTKVILLIGVVAGSIWGFIWIWTNPLPHFGLVSVRVRTLLILTGTYLAYELCRAVLGSGNKPK